MTSEQTIWLGVIVVGAALWVYRLSIGASGSSRTILDEERTLAGLVSFRIDKHGQLRILGEGNLARDPNDNNAIILTREQVDDFYKEITRYKEQKAKQTA
jgi:hypothetical protein